MNSLKKSLLLLIFLTFSPVIISDDHLHTLNLQDADIRLLIETVSDITGKNFVVDSEVQGKVTVISGHPVPEDEIYNIFLSLLSVNGYAAIDEGSSVKIVPESQAGSVIASDKSKYPNDYVTRIVALEYVPASELVNMLKGVSNQKAKVIAHKESNLLIISDRAKNVDKMLAIVRRIDKKSDSSIELITLEHANATEVAQTLESLLDTGATTLNAKTKIVADERTNSVIVNADPTLKLKIETLIAQLDKPLDTNSQSQVISLKYSDAESLVPILETLANKTLGGEAENSSAKATIQAHVDTNSLVINAPPTIFKNLQSAIEKLDIKRAQVLVEAIIVELTIDHSKEAGFQWQGLLSQLNGEGLIGGTNYGIVGNILNPPSPFGDGAINNGVNIGYVQTDGDGNPQLGAVLSALAANTNNNILSTPSVVTLNNKEAKLSVGQEVPFRTGQFTNTGANEGSANPFTTIERKDIGVSLTVTPHINEGNQIVLDIAQEVSSLAQSSTALADVVTNKRTLTTSVMVPDDGVIVLGGLIDDTVLEDVRKVPVLGDIPVLRNLFRHKKKTRVKRNLMIFLHPKILTDANQATITNQKYNELRDLQNNGVNESEFNNGRLDLPEKIQ